MKRHAGEAITEEFEEQVTEALDYINAFAKSGTSRDMILKRLQRANFADSVIETAFSKYRESIAMFGGAEVLRDKRAKEKMGWYNPTLEPDPNSRWGKLKKVLEAKGWPSDHIEDLDNQSNSVVSNLMPPNGANGLVKGLVLGYVQSGKTANFSATIAKACDEKYRIIIVLSGMHNNLRAQTQKRLEAELIEPHGGRKSFKFTNTSDNGDFKRPDTPVDSYLTSEGKIVLAVLKKNTSVMRKFNEWIMEASDDALKHSPVLIIDDEADQASLNESRRDNERTKTNGLIVELLTFLGDRAPTSYVGYTATPFANILLNADDEEDLFPRDFIVALKAPETYVGAEKLFGRVTAEGEVVQPLNLIRHIDLSEAIEDEDEVNIGEMEIPASLKTAITTFFISAAERIRKSGEIRRPDLQKNITMLVHTSALTDDHYVLTKSVNNHVNTFKAMFEAKHTDAINELEKVWKQDFEPTMGDNAFSKESLGSFADMLECLEIFLNEMVVLEINSKSKNSLSFTEPKTWAIVIGGSKLSRGLTIEGLTVSYFHRNSRGYDTLLQMGRWFGYRPNYLHLTRIFVTSQMEANFHHLATVEHELREDIERMVENNETPLDMALKIRAHDELEITLKKSKNNATISSHTYSGQKISATLVKLDDEEWAANNAKAVKHLALKLETGGYRQPPPYLEFKNCLLYKNVPVDPIINFLKKYRIVKEEIKLSNSLLIDYINKLAHMGELTQWSVAIMSKNKHEDDKLIELGPGMNVTAVDRRQSPRYSGDSFDRLKNVSIMNEELIDLGDKIKTDRISEYVKQNGLKPTLVRNDYRPPERGLLLIYPINTNHSASPEERQKMKEESKLYPVISDIKELYTFTLVFPPTKAEAFNCTYVENPTVGRGVA